LAKQKVLLGVISIIVCEVLFGFSFLFTKSITASVSALTLLSWRFVIALVMMSLCAAAGIIKLNFRGKSITPLFLVAVFHPVLYFIGETTGIRLTTASESGTVIACIPIAAIILSTLILKEPPTRLQTAGIAVSMAGIIVIVLAKGGEATFSLFGYALLLSAVISYGLFAVYSQKTAQFSSAEKTFAMVALGAVTFTGAALWENARAGTLAEFAALPAHSPEFLTAILYLGVGCSVVAFLLNNISLAAIGTNRSASFAGLTTVVAVLAGVIILKEEFSVFQGAGAVLVLGGIYLANMAPRVKAAAGEPAAYPD
jgi:drug/metabolite transporter (DMT)-like permease